MTGHFFSGYRSLRSPLIAGSMVILLATCFTITLEVLLRKVFSMSLGGADEYSGYLFAIFSALAYSHAAADKANIRIDVLYNLFPKSAKVVADILAQIALIIFVAPLTWAAVKLTVSSFENGSRAATPLATPLFFPQGVWSFALILLLTVLASMFLASVVALVRGDINRFHKIADPASLAEEIEREIGRKAAEAAVQREGRQ